MRLSIIDDDKNHIKTLRELLTNHSDVEIVSTSLLGHTGLKQLVELQPDAVFLDVEMPDISGIDLMSEIPPECRVIIFTAHGKYSVEALRNKAFDFLKKPILDSELDIILERLRKDIKECEEKREIASRPSNCEHFITFVNTEDFCMLRLCDIGVLCFNQTARCWEAIVAGRTNPVKLRRKVKAFNILSWCDKFVQVHQSYIVNIAYLAEVSDNVCHLLPPFDHITGIKMGRFYRKRFISRFFSNF